MGSSRTRAQARVPCIDRRFLNHCAIREAPEFSLLFGSKYFLISNLIYSLTQRLIRSMVLNFEMYVVFLVIFMPLSSSLIVLYSENIHCMILMLWNLLIISFWLSMVKMFLMHLKRMHLLQLQGAILCIYIHWVEKVHCVVQIFYIPAYFCLLVLAITEMVVYKNIFHYDYGMMFLLRFYLEAMLLNAYIF